MDAKASGPRGGASLRLLTTAALAAAAVSCGGSGVRVSADNFRFVGMPGRLQAGGHRFVFSNRQAGVIHELVILRLSGGTSASEVVELARRNGRGAEDAFRHAGEIAHVDAGTAKTGTFGLRPGNYALACFETSWPAGGGRVGTPHAAAGMVFGFTVG